jgi:hypothetical protein
MAARIAVTGGDLASITAALRCVDAGHEVTLMEAHPFLGGMTHSLRRGELHVDNGQHVFHRCVFYLALSDRLRVTDLVTLQPRPAIQIRSPGLRQPVWLPRNGLPVPPHLADSVLRYRPLGVGDRLQFAGAALALSRVDLAAPSSDQQSFGEWLAARGQSDRAVETLWDLVGVATLTATAAGASLGLAATVFQEGLLTQAPAADVDWSNVPLRQLHGDPAQERRPGAGAHVLLGTKVFDRKVMGEPFLAGVDSPVQWVFARTAESGQCAGQYVAIPMSADELIDVPVREIRERILLPLLELLPRATDAEVRDFFVTRERHATFRPAPGFGAVRPATRAEGLVPAGAWTAIEGAVRSGDAAARVLISETVLSTPEGVSACPPFSTHFSRATRRSCPRCGPRWIGWTRSPGTSRPITSAGPISTATRPRVAARRCVRHWRCCRRRRPARRLSAGCPARSRWSWCTTSPSCTTT